MPIHAACVCGKVFQAPDSLAGKRVKCPQCGQAFDIALPGANDDPLGLGDLASWESAANPLQIERPAPSSAPIPEHAATVEQLRPKKPVPRNAAMSARATREFQRGIGMLIGGPVMAVVGVVATVMSYQSPDTSGSFTVFHGLVLGGLITFGYGVMSIIRARNFRTGAISESGEAGIDRFARNLGFLPVLIVAVILTVLGVFATLLFG